jgi:hypothetical protein
MEQGPFCQSCGMPLQKQADFGTNADGSKNSDYCHFCFQNGAFTQPDITMEAKIELVVKNMVAMKLMPEKQAREMANAFIPQLKRWQKK